MLGDRVHIPLPADGIGPIQLEGEGFGVVQHLLRGCLLYTSQPGAALLQLVDLGLQGEQVLAVFRLCVPQVGGDGAVTAPVSYTHLDVYKRQVLKTTASASFLW